jgi:prepilin-type N-terminal cleavage/methylation domain-containing protein
VTQHPALQSHEGQPAILKRRGFSLVELLVVVAIIGIVLTFLVPAFSSIKTANDLTNAINGVAGTLEWARTYAMANNIYVYVGIAEVNADVAVETAPQSPATDSAGGRVAIAVVAVRDGTLGYNLLSSLPDPAWTSYNNGSGLIPLGKLEIYENVHLANSLGTIPAMGSMARPAASSTYSLGNPACKSLTPFSWPLGTALGSGQYNFEKVIQFDPQGVARIQYATNQDIIVGWMEIALQQSHGSLIPPAPANPTGAIAAIQLDGMTGVVRVYRP